MRIRHYCDFALLTGLLLSLWLSPGEAGQRGVFIDSESNIRQSPSTKAKILKVSTKGVAFDILEQNGKWARIKTPDGLEGWTNAINFVILKETDPGVSGAPNAPASAHSATPTAVKADPPGPKKDATGHTNPVDPGTQMTSAQQGVMQSESRPHPDLSAEITRRQAAVEQSPQDPVAHFMLGVALLDGGDITGAKSQIASLKKLNPTLADDLQRLISR